MMLAQSDWVWKYASQQIAPSEATRTRNLGSLKSAVAPGSQRRVSTGCQATNSPVDYRPARRERWREPASNNQLFAKCRNEESDGGADRDFADAGSLPEIDQFRHPKVGEAAKQYRQRAAFKPLDRLGNSFDRVASYVVVP